MDLSIKLLPNGDAMLLAGDPPFEFGRAEGRGFVADDRSISAHHGTIEVDDTAWRITSCGSYYSFTVHDMDTPSRITVPLGAGPVVIPFDRSFVTIDIGDGHWFFSVERQPTTGWADGWRSVLLNQDADNNVSRVDTLVADAHRGIRWRKGTGATYRWYQLLVAMCEPRLSPPFEDRIPNNRELAQRLGVAPEYLNKSLIPDLRRRLGFDSYEDELRRIAVTLAITQGLVTPADLAILDEDTDE